MHLHVHVHTQRRHAPPYRTALPHCICTASALHLHVHCIYTTNALQAREVLQNFTEGRTLPAGAGTGAGAEAGAEAGAGTESEAVAEAGEAEAETGESTPKEAKEAGSQLRLWATGECGERWRGALRAPASFATVALCARALRSHADAFAIAAAKRRNSERISFELESWYHAGAFVEKERTASRRKRRKY